MNVNLENNGVKNGLVLAAVAVIISIIIYFIDKSLFLSPAIRFFASILLPVFFMRKAVLEERAELNGYIKFSEAIQPAYLTLIIGVIGFSIFQYIIMTMDFELLEIQREIAVDSIKKLSGFAGLTEENIAQFEDIKAEDLKPDLKALLLGLAKNFILGFILAAITAAVLKREQLTND